MKPPAFSEDATPPCEGSWGQRWRQFLKYCAVGGSGVLVDMTVLHVLVADWGWTAVAGKLAAAQSALLNNFFWNEVWTFRRDEGASREGRWLGRLGRFQAICMAGIGLATGTLHLLHARLGMNLYLANFLAIGLATAWNFGLNAWLTWPVRRQRDARGDPQ